jgi:hypothetical protein
VRRERQERLRRRVRAERAHVVLDFSGELPVAREDVLQLRLVVAKQLAHEDEDEAAPAADEPDGFEMDDEDAAQADEPLLQDALPAAEGQGVPAGTDEDDEEEGDGMIIDDDA